MTLIYEVTAGSYLYGLNREGSDRDKGQVMLESKELLLGIEDTPALVQTQEQGDGEELDKQRHWLKRFCYLASVKGNPNVLEWLFVPPEQVHVMHPAFKKVIGDPIPFLGLKAIAASHMGFAKAQLHKMMVKNPQMGAARRKLVDTYGYDVKYASHALRLVYQLEELATHGRITFPYPLQIHDVCMRVKTGYMSLDAFKAAFHELAERVDKDVLPKSHLPAKCDVKEINRRLVEFRETVWAS